MVLNTQDGFDSLDWIQPLYSALLANQTLESVEIKKKMTTMV